MTLINRCCYPSSILRLSAFWIFGVMMVVGHLALFQLVDASMATQSKTMETREGASIAKMSLPLGNGGNKKPFRGQDVISLVPEEDRELFLLWHLAPALNTISPRLNIEQGIPKIKSEAFKKIRTYDTFSADLLKWTMQTLKLSQYDVKINLPLRRYRRVICTSKGWCFSPSDMANLCCPF